MKLCITATGNTLEARTDPSFGRAPWLILVDTDTLAFEAIENTGVNATQGAGIAAAQTISNKGAQALFTGRVGPKAWAALESADIAIHEGIADSSVREAVAMFKSNVNRDSAGSVSRTGPGAGGGPGSGSGGQGSGRGRCGGSGMGRGGGGRCRMNQGPGQRRDK